MTLHTNSERYTSVAVFLHWTIALLILIMIAVGLTMGDYPIDLRFIAVNLHKSIGITILALSLFRLIWRLTHRPPPLPAHMKGWERFAADLSHWMFYGFMIAMPLSGWLYVSALAKYPTLFFFLVEVPHLPVPADKQLAENIEGVHFWLAMSLLALLAVHVGAALKHHFIEHDSVLRRMLPLWLQRRGKVVL